MSSKSSLRTNPPTIPNGAGNGSGTNTGSTGVDKSETSSTVLTPESSKSTSTPSKTSISTSELPTTDPKQPRPTIKNTPKLSTYLDDSHKYRPVTLIAVSFKEAVLDSPTFRASMNHVNEQLDSLDRWIESFSKALNKLSQEMDGKS